MSYSWINKKTNFYRENSQDYQLSGQNGASSQKAKTKAYLNPEIVNCEYIKRSLSKNGLQGGNKIHVNPNFKGNGLNKTSRKTNLDLNNLVCLNSHNELLYEPGPSNTSNFTSTSTSDFKTNKLPLSGNERLSNTTVVKHQSRFKKVNVNVSVQSKNTSQYSWSSGSNNPDVIRSRLAINKISSVPVVKTLLEKNKYNSGGNSYRSTSKNLVKLPSQMCQTSKNISIYKSKTKIINESKTKLLNSVSPKNKLNLVDKKTSNIKRPLTLSRFVYHRNSPVTRVAKAVRTKYKYLNNSEEFKRSKYKIDKRNKLQETVRKKLNVIKDIRKLFPNYFYTKLKSPPCKIYQVDNRLILSKSSSTWRKNQASNNVSGKILNQFPNKRVVKIGGILYKSTANKLTLANKSPTSNPTKSITGKSKAKKNHIVYVRGEKFILENNGKALRRQSQSTKNKKSLLHTTKRIDIGGVTYIQKSQNVLIRTNVHKARYLVNKAKNKSIALLANLHKRSSMPCMIYHRFGKCNRHTSGLCIYKHDPKNVALCKNFLKGNCVKENCLLSHQVIQEKMATCHFFLNGLCVRENCPFLHVKLNKNVAICEDFLQGFCNLGKNCSKRHFHQCPKFDKYGTCSLGSKCHYPHIKQNKSELGTENACENSEEPKNPNEGVQYYVNSGPHKKQKKTKKVISKEKESSAIKTNKRTVKRKTLSLNSPEESDDVITCLPKRIRLDKLPCYIPLKSDT